MVLRIEFYGLGLVLVSVGVVLSTTLEDRHDEPEHYFSISYKNVSLAWFLSYLNSLHDSAALMCLTCSPCLCHLCPLASDGGGAAPVSVRLSTSPGCQLPAGDPRTLRLFRHPRAAKCQRGKHELLTLFLPHLLCLRRPFQTLHRKKHIFITSVTVTSLVLKSKTPETHWKSETTKQ